MWTPNRNNGNIEYVGNKEVDIKGMLVNVINDTTIDYNRGCNKLWDMGLDDSKDKKYYMLDKPIVKPNFINVSFILELIILKNNNWEIDKVNVFPAIGGYCGCQNIELQFEYTNKDNWDKSIKELAEVARELGYEPVKNCPISFTQEILFRKIGTWNKPYIMRKRRSRYMKSSWNAMTDGFGSLKPYMDEYKWNLPVRGTKSNKELQLEEYYNIPLSKKVPKKIQKEWNFWAKVIIDHEQMIDYYFYNEYVNDQERTEAENAYDEIVKFVKESKLGYRTLFKNADKLFPREYDNWGAFKNDVLKHIIAWKFYKIYAGPWVSRNGAFSDVMGIGEENQNSQGNYYL